MFSLEVDHIFFNHRARICRYFVDVLASKESADCQEVQLFVDGSWKVYEEDVTDLTEKDKPKNSVPNSPSENVSYLH